MSTGRTWQIASTSLKDTLALAEQIGRKLKGGEAIELISDLGGGKTTFVRGLAKGLGSHDVVRSPSFTLSNQYRAENLILHHLDLHRLDQAGIIKEIVSETLEDSSAIVVIEWADVVKDLLPAERLVINIKVIDENSREFSFNIPKQLNYLTDDL